MRENFYHLVDVFTDVPFGGNPLAVFTDATNISPKEMQQIAKELNLSETTFVLPPTDGKSDFRVRIFTPAKELPMAGHPTVGTAFVLQHLGRLSVPSQFTFEEGVGQIPVELSQDGGQISATMTQLLPEFREILADRAAVAAMLSINEDDLLPDYPVQVVSTGVPMPFIPVRSLEVMARLRLRTDLWEQYFRAYDELFMFTPHAVRAGSTVHSRMFAPGLNIPEDPATGAASGPLGAYLVQYGLAPAGHIISEQGFEMGRPSIVHIHIGHDGQRFTRVQVGGGCVYMGNGMLVLGDA